MHNEANLMLHNRPQNDSLKTRFMTHVLEDENGCWVWQMSPLANGYGRFSPNDVLAHRWGYRFFKGAIPDGLVLDHLCRNRPCVNPDHLEAVTTAVNIRRGNTGIKERSKTHCPKGHEYSPENTYRRTTDKSRHCRTCVLAQQKAKRDQKAQGK